MFLVLWGVCVASGSARLGLRLKLDKSGLSSISYGGLEYLGFGDFRVNQVIFQSSQGATFAGDLRGTTTVDPVASRLVRTLPWGSITVVYKGAGNRMTATITVDNRSTDTIKELWFEPLGLRFPSKPREYNGVVPLLTDTIGQPAVVRVTYKGGSVVLASEDRAKPVQLGFPWAFDSAKTLLSVSVNTGRVSSFPGSCPTIRRTIAGGTSDSFSFSLRFGAPSASAEVLAADIYRRFKADFPPTLEWSDHRALGALFLSTANAGWPKNPRGWLQDAKLETDSPAGIEQLKTRVLAYADASIAILKKMDAQGMITWDIEGQQYPHATSYIGDPRLLDTLAPEMNGIADEYFARFRSAGLRVGVCIRPQQLIVQRGKRTASQTPVADPAQLLIEKALYANRRWGATLFYVDSNVNADDLNPMDPAVFKKVAAALPTALFIPEHAKLEYYAYTAPYRELRQEHPSTDSSVRNIFPNAFSVIYTVDGGIDAHRSRLIAGVQRGDVLLFRGWYDDGENAKDSEIYREAVRTATAPAGSQRIR